MSYLFDEIMQDVKKGDKEIVVDLKKKNLKVDKKYLVKEGTNYSEWLFFSKKDKEELKNKAWQKVEELYELYKYSVPQGRKGENSKYFEALEYNELSVKDLLANKSRYEAKMELELFILLASIARVLKWDNDRHWFYQGKMDKELVVLKDWVVKE